MNQEEIILVDEKDNPIGSGEKLTVHQGGRLHRAFSIFIANSKGDWLLQKRSRKKYHSGGLWTNACCSHPQKGESLDKAVHRRLKEEMGFDCRLKEVFSFVYKAKLDNGLIEHEYDHVFIGRFNGQPVPDPDEAEGWRWIAPEKIRKEIKKSPENYSYWFKKSFEKVADCF